jgi:hypothetical protein
MNSKELRDSHAIPNSFFAKILRKNNGKLVEVIDDKTSPISYSADSWSEKLLCFDCEQHISNTFEGKAIQILRGKLCSVVKTERSVVQKESKKISTHQCSKYFFARFFGDQRCRSIPTIHKLNLQVSSRKY